MHGMPGADVHNGKEPSSRHRPVGTDQVLPALPNTAGPPGDTVTFMARTQRRRAATAPAARDESQDSVERVRDNAAKPAPAPIAARIARPEPRTKRNPFGFLKRIQPRFVADIVAELRKVTWPTFAETRYLTVVVAIVAVAMGLFLGTLDLGFGWIVERIFFS